MEKKETRAGIAGHKMGKAIIESIHLMYQNKTALNYLRELVLALELEYEIRKKDSK